MKRTVAAIVGVAGFACLSAQTASAQEPLKIGLVSVLSGPQAALGQQVRDGFQLAVKNLGGKMAGRAVRVVVVDDELKPMSRSRVCARCSIAITSILSWAVFSNILVAIHKPVTESGTILISPNAGTSNFAGKQCNENFFVTSYQNDPAASGHGQICAGQGLQALLHHGAELSRGKRLARRL